MAAEYEVNIKLNSREIETQLGQIDRKIAKIGKPKGGSSGKRAGIAGLLPSSTELKAAERGLTQLTAKTKNIQSIQDKFSERRIRALTRSNSLNEKELRLNRQLTNEARQRLRLLSQSGAKGFDATRPQGRQMSENINALTNAQEKRARLVNKINEMEARGLNVDKLRKQLGKATTEQSARRFASATKEFRLLEKTIRLEESKLRILKQQQQGFASSPIRGGANMPGSPLARQARNKRLEQVGLGAGFPLLFGGGAGSVIGGGVGGLTGSFGAQIALSAAGQQIDQLIGRTIASAESLTSVGTALDFLRKRSLFSSEESEQLARKLENQGDLAGIAALVTEELNDALGPDGIQKMKDLAEETKLAKKQFGELTTNLELLISGPLTNVLGIINEILGVRVTQNRFSTALEKAIDAAPERKSEIKALMEGERNLGVNVRGLLSSAIFGSRTAAGVADIQGFDTKALERMTESLNQIIKEADIPKTALPITEEDRERFKPKNFKATPKEKLQQRLDKLEEERKKVLEISRFRDKIAAAEAAEDEELVIRLQGEQRIAEIEASRLKDLVGITEQREIDTINIGKATEKLAAHRATERELGELQLQRQQKFEDTIEDLEHQLALAQATTEQEREQLRIEKKLQDLRDDGLSESQIGQIGDLMQQISAENSPLNQFIKQSIESLNNLEQHAVEVAQGIGNAIGNSLTSGMQNLVSGAATAKEVFADMLKSIADVLAQQAAKMISTYIAIGVARMFAGFDSAGAFSRAPSDAAKSAAAKVFSQPAEPFRLGAFAEGSYAQGGYVSGPTRALIGEGGQPEYVIPASKMTEAMGRYARGARGAAVIPEGDGTSTESGMNGISGVVDVRYSVERINNVDYVTAAVRAWYEPSCQTWCRTGTPRCLQ